MSNIDAIRANVSPLTKSQDVLTETLRTMRTHLGMEVSYLSEFVGNDLVFRAVDAPGFGHLAGVGDRMPLVDTYCQKILSGAFPNMIPDTLALPEVAAMPITHQIPIRAHISVPIERADGSVYGMFCCLSSKPNTTLNDRDLQLMKSFARLAQYEVQRVVERDTQHKALSDLIKSTVRDQRFELLYQPIVDLCTGQLTGAEALCRFQSDPYRAPNLWFEDAARVGLGEMLEICVMEPAINTMELLPDDAYVSFNASPRTIATGLLAPVFEKRRPKRVVLEVTEHIEVDDWAALSREINVLREMGILIAIDDAGAGYSGLQQIVRLRPDIIKLDRSLVDHIDQDPARRSLCAAMVHFATETGAALVAEGIERPEEERVLRDLGVHRGQGFLLARPMPMAQLLDTYGAPLRAAQ